jgi:ParB family chromosome partitioning protein
MTDTKQEINQDVKIINAEHIAEPPNPNRVELDDEKIKDLAQSIKSIGLQQPLVVRAVGDKFEIVAGHRRFKACLQVGVINIPCIIRELTDEQAEQVKAHENLYRADLSCTEEAIFLARITEKNPEKIPEAARIVGRTEAWVKERLEILQYPEYFWPALDSGTISLGVAKSLAQITDELYRKMFFEQAIRDGMKVWQAEYYLNQWQAGIFKEGSEILPPPTDAKPNAVATVRQICAKCGQVAESPNLTNVFVHVECPTPPPLP